MALEKILLTQAQELMIQSGYDMTEGHRLSTEGNVDQSKAYIEEAHRKINQIKTLYELSPELQKLFLEKGVEPPSIEMLLKVADQVRREQIIRQDQPESGEQAGAEVTNGQGEEDPNVDQKLIIRDFAVPTPEAMSERGLGTIEARAYRAIYPATEQNPLLRSKWVQATYPYEPLESAKSKFGSIKRSLNTKLADDNLTIYSPIKHREWTAGVEPRYWITKLNPNGSTPATPESPEPSAVQENTPPVSGK
jgi:hypothetical protein